MTLTRQAAPTLADERPEDCKIALMVALPRLIAELDRCEKNEKRYRALDGYTALAELYGAESRILRFALSCIGGSLLILGPNWRADLEKYVGVTK
jgi:hypothetical protein